MCDNLSEMLGKSTNTSTSIADCWFVVFSLWRLGVYLAKSISGLGSRGGGAFWCPRPLVSPKPPAPPKLPRVPQATGVPQARGCSGAGVGVGMLRGRGIPLVESKKGFGFLVAKFLGFVAFGSCFKVSCFLVSKLHRSNVPRSNDPTSPKNHLVLSGRY